MSLSNSLLGTLLKAQEQLSSKTKTKASPKAKSKNTIESVAIAPEPMKTILT
jgi:hypothetical protein